jgi:hypothetical protein
MKWLELLFWLSAAWGIWQLVKQAREAWNLYPENPSRVYLADLAGTLLFIAILGLLYPSLHFTREEDDQIVLSMFALPAGVGQIQRGHLLIVKIGDSPDKYAQRVAALPGDLLSVKDGVLHVNGVPIEGVPNAFPSFSTNCDETEIPAASIAVVNRPGEELQTCSLIVVIPESNIIFRCLAVLWPLSERCHRPTAAFPPPSNDF